jgi:hypothetical protein
MAVDESVRSSGHRLRGLAPLLLAAALVLSSCALDANLTRDAPVPAIEAPVVAARCPTTATAVEDVDVPTIPGGSRPAGFRATDVLRCTIETTEDDEGRTTSTVTVDRAPATGELERALELPDQVFVDPEQGVCTADAVLLPLLLLTDGNERAYRPRLPLTACAKPRPELVRALAGLTFVRVDRYAIARPG